MSQNKGISLPTTTTEDHNMSDFKVGDTVWVRATVMREGDLVAEIGLFDADDHLHRFKARPGSLAIDTETYDVTRED